MKKIKKTLFMLGVVASCMIQAVLAQVPAGFQYQAVARDAEGNPLSEQPVSLRLSLLPGSGTADAVFTETHSVTTNRFGLITLQVGDGSAVTGDIESVDWSSTPMYLKVEMDPSGGSSYSEMGTSQLLSVPYALHAASGVQGPPGPQGPAGPQGEAGTGLTGRGNWVSGTTYDPGDYVFDRSSDDPEINSMWIMQATGPLVSELNPYNDPDNWIEFQAPHGEPGLLQAGSEPGNTPYWDGEQWVTGSSNLFNNGGNIGIGTTSPTQALDIEGNLRLRSHLYDRTNSMGTTGQVLTRTATGVLWSDAISGTGSTGNLAYWSGTRQLGSIPYIIYSEDESVQIASREDAGDDDPIFEVKNRDDQVVLGVYQTGVRIYVDEVEEVEQTKGSRAGFAVGGFSQSKQEEVEYLRIDPGTVRITVDEDKSEETKGSRGGFAVGGFTSQKQGLIQEFLRVTSDSVRIYVFDDQEVKGSRGGFAVGGFTAGKSETSGDLMSITSQNYFIGHKSGEANTDGLYNSFLGFESGMSNTTGSKNVFIGYQSGILNTTGSWNTFVGLESGYTNEADYNSFFGYRAGRSNTTGTYNSFFGYDAGYSNTTGSNNVMMGYMAGSNGSTGQNAVLIGSYAGYNNNGPNNIFIGNEAGYNTTTARGNVFMGIGSGKANTLGDFNVFIGNLAGTSNTEGDQSIFIGDRSGRYNTTGSQNVFIGNYAGQNNTTGNYNVYIGYEAGLKSNASFNLFLGYQAGNENTSGYHNTFLGYQSGLNNKTGYENAFIGYQTGLSNASGFRNVFLGWKAGLNNKTGNYNIFIGREAGMDNDDGTSNVYLGESSGQKNVSGSGNTFLGKSTGANQTEGGYNVYIGGQSAIYKTSGDANVHIGWHSGANSAGDNNVLIGYFAGMSSVGSGNVFIGYKAGQNASGWKDRLIIENSTDQATPLIYGEFDNDILVFNGRVGMGTSPTYRLELPNDATNEGGKGRAYGWDTHSDARVKSGIRPVGYGLKQVLMLSGRSYHHHSSEFKDGSLILSNGNNTIGLIAQEVFRIIPEAVHKPENDSNELWGIDYNKLVPVLIRAIQEQHELIMNQQEQIKDLQEQQVSLQMMQNENELLKSRVELIMEMLTVASKN